MEIITPKPVKKEVKLRILKKSLAKVKINSNPSEKKVSIDDKEKFIQTIAKIKTRNNIKIQKSEVLPSWTEFLNQNEGSLERSENKSIQRSQQLPPYMPVSSSKRNISKPKNNCLNLLPKSFASKRNSKIRISLRGSTENVRKPRTYSVWGSVGSNPKITLNERANSILKGSRIASKDSRKRSKTRLSLINNKNFIASKYKLNKNHLDFRDFSSKQCRPFQEENVSKVK